MARDDGRTKTTTRPHPRPRQRPRREAGGVTVVGGECVKPHGGPSTFSVSLRNKTGAQRRVVVRFYGAPASSRGFRTTLAPHASDFVTGILPGRGCTVKIIAGNQTSDFLDLPYSIE
jgi:hypothetical protein